MTEIDTIMLMAAGKGTRMGELSKDTPKCLLQISGKPILYYALELCKNYPFKQIVINTHYFPEKIENALRLFRALNPDFPKVITIYEEDLLETGGGIKNALHLLGEGPIFKMNTDVIIKSKENLFKQMQSQWNAEKMDFLLLLQPYDQAVGYRGNGDFDLDEEGRVSRGRKGVISTSDVIPTSEVIPTSDVIPAQAGIHEAWIPGPSARDDVRRVARDDVRRVACDDVTHNTYPYMFTGLEILKPQLIAQNSAKIFSLKDYYFESLKAYGYVSRHTDWYHATRPEDLVEIEKMIARKR